LRAYQRALGAKFCAIDCTAGEAAANRIGAIASLDSHTRVG
jgi:hypothetical protein